MKLLTRAVDGAARVLFNLARVLLALMMLVIVIEVVGRALFGATGGAVDITVPGAIELVRFALLFTIVGALPYMVENGQVVVDSLTTGLSERLKERMFAIYLLGFCAFGALLAYGWYQSGAGALEYGEVTQDLRIPMAWPYFGAAACALVLALRSALCAVRFMRGEPTA